MRIIINLLVTAIVAYLLQTLLSGVHFNDFGAALLFAAVLGLLNMFVKPILKIVTLPISIITLGIFSLFINAIVISLADYLMDSVEIDGFLWTFLFSILLSGVTSLLFVGDDK